MTNTSRLPTLSLPILLLVAIAASVSVTMSSIGGEPVGNLTVSKAGPGRPVDPLEAFSYSIAYTNVGNKTETGIALRETVPNLTRAIGNSDWEVGSVGSGQTCHKVPAGTECFLELESLPPTATGTAEFSVQVVSQPPKGVSLLENVIVIGNLTTGTLIIDDSDTALTELSLPRLDLRLSDMGSTVRGARHEYALEVVNLGGQTARQVFLMETVPDHTAAGINRGWELELLDGTMPCEGAGPGSVCSFSLGDLPGGAVRTVPFTVGVDRTIPDGIQEIYNQAAVEASNTEASTAELVTPLEGSLAVVDIPTLSTAGLGLLAFLTVLAAGYQLRRTAHRAPDGPAEGKVPET